MGLINKIKEHRRARMFEKCFSKQKRVGHTFMNICEGKDAVEWGLLDGFELYCLNCPHFLRSDRLLSYVWEEVMKREPNTDDNLIPVRSKEATAIIGKLVDKSVAIFEECGVNMALNGRSTNEIKEELKKTLEFINSYKPPESYILICSPEMASLINQFGTLPENVTIQKSPHCCLDKAYLVKSQYFNPSAIPELETMY